jgi:hypothetical protein
MAQLRATTKLFGPNQQGQSTEDVKHYSALDAVPFEKVPENGLVGRWIKWVYRRLARVPATVSRPNHQTIDSGGGSQARIFKLAPATANCSPFGRGRRQLPVVGKQFA